MRALRAIFMLLLLLVAGTAARADAPAEQQTTCVGKFPNPLTDICWSCILPISLGSSTIMNIGGQEDNGENPGAPLCSCGLNPTVGLSVGFWEPARHVEVVRRPFCLLSLGGVDLNPGIAAPEAGWARLPGGARSSFYQAHYYSDPILAWLNVVADFPCLERGGFDLVYLTEVDPSWNDDALTAILEPEAVLFANPVAQLACAADCIKASTGFGSRDMFWCAGCQGSLYPLNGHVASHGGGVRSAELLAQRLTAKLHRELVALGWHGKAGLCGPYLEPVMDKTAYKTQLVYPVPATGKIAGLQAGPGGDAVPAAGTGRCCQPFGRTTALWGAGKEYPVKGEDFSFMLFRKRNCCVGY